MALEVLNEYDDYEEDGEVETSRTYAIDWDKKRMVGTVDGLEAVNQFIKKVLITPRFQSIIYSFDYGSEIQDCIRETDNTESYLEVEIPALVEEALYIDDRILNVYDFEFEYSTSESVTVKFKVDTIYGETEIEEVIT